MYAEIKWRLMERRLSFTIVDAAAAAAWERLCALLFIGERSAYIHTLPLDLNLACDLTQCPLGSPPNKESHSHKRNEKLNGSELRRIAYATGPNGQFRSNRKLLARLLVACRKRRIDIMCANACVACGMDEASRCDTHLFFHSGSFDVIYHLVWTIFEDEQIAHNFCHILSSMLWVE